MKTHQSHRLRVLRLGAFLLLSAGMVAPLDLPGLLPVAPRFALTVWAAACVAMLWPYEGWPAFDCPRWLLGPALAFLTVSVALWPWSFDRVETAREIVAFGVHVFVLLATFSFAVRERQASSIWLGCVLASIAVAEAVAFTYHVEVGLTTRPKTYIPETWSGYPELGFLASVAVAILFATFQRARPRHAWAALLLLGAMLLQTMFLFSRLSYVAAGVAGALSLLQAARSRTWHRVLIAAAIAGTMAVGLLSVNATFRHLGRGVLGSTSARGGDIEGVRVDVATRETRLKIWTRTMSMIADHPLGAGVGLGNFREVYEPGYNPDLNTDGRRGVHAHNAWLHKAGETGIVGGLAFAVLCGAVLALAMRDAWRANSMTSYALLGVVVVLFVQNTAENFFWISYGARGRLQGLQWMAFGLIAARSAVRIVGSATDVRTGS